MSATESVGLTLTEKGMLLVDELTGELVPLDSATDDVIASALRRVRVRMYELLEAERFLGEELIRHMDLAASWTVRARGVEVTAPTPSKGTVEWSGDELYVILQDLVNEGVISKDAMAAAVKPKVEYQVLLRGVTALINAGHEDRIKSARKSVEQKPRKVKVSVKRGGE